MDVLSEIRSWLELAYFVSQVLLMIIVLLGLRQLTLAKNQLVLSESIFRTQSKRQSVEAAVLECRRFSETIVLDCLALDQYCKKHDISYFDDVVFARTERGFTVDPSKAKKEDIVKIGEAGELLNKLINGMEAYALFFLSGVADEKIAYHCNAKTYVETAEHLFKLFPICNVDDEDAEPVKVLYMRWRKKREEADLKVQRAALDKKLSEYSVKQIKAIGT